MSIITLRQQCRTAHFTVAVRVLNVTTTRPPPNRAVADAVVVIFRRQFSRLYYNQVDKIPKGFNIQQVGDVPRQPLVGALS